MHCLPPSTFDIWIRLGPLGAESRKKGNGILGLTSTAFSAWPSGFGARCVEREWTQIWFPLNVVKYILFLYVPWY